MYWGLRLFAHAIESNPKAGWFGEDRDARAALVNPAIWEIQATAGAAPGGMLLQGSDLAAAVVRPRRVTPIRSSPKTNMPQQWTFDLSLRLIAGGLAVERELSSAR
jgi:hypothetical protein